jgi:hypothetical protein
MLANAQGVSEPPPDDHVRREILSVLAALGPLLLSASRAVDSPEPRSAYPPLRDAARVLAPYVA